LGALIVAALGVACASTWQHAQERRVRNELKLADTYALAAETNLKRLNALQAGLKEAQAAAQLCCFLQRAWPRTHVLAAVAQAIPPEVELMELEIVQEEGAGDPSSFRTRGAGAQDAQAAAKPPALQDLRRLDEEQGAKQTVLRLAGVAADPAAIHRFVADLGQRTLFARADLGSLETVDETERGPVTRFTARVVLCDALESRLSLRESRATFAERKATIGEPAAEAPSRFANLSLTRHQP
jgi:Tfp pilus assembly protein PilN